MSDMRKLINLMESVMAVPSIGEATREPRYFSVFTYDSGFWSHYGDFDAAEDAADERYSLKSDGTKSIMLRVPKSEANWKNINVDDYVHSRLNAKKMGESESEMQTQSSVGQAQADVEFDLAQSSMSEEEELDEISKSLRDRYVNRASTDHGHSSFAARVSKDDEGKTEYAKRAEKRANGLIAALNDRRTNQSVTESDSFDSIVTEKSTSEKQARFMAACAHGADYDSCPSDDVSTEFNKADKGTSQLSNAMKNKTVESVPAIKSCRQTNPANATVACAMEEEMSGLDEEVSELNYRQAMDRFMSMYSMHVEPNRAFDVLKNELVDQGFDPNEIKQITDAIEQELWPDSEMAHMDEPDDHSADAEALASAGHGSDEDYGDIPFEESLQNGYDSIDYADGDDYFPNGADSPVVKATGPSGARQGDNPEQKKMQVAETHTELVYAYRSFLKESTTVQKKRLTESVRISNIEVEEFRGEFGDTGGAIEYEGPVSFSAKVAGKDGVVHEIMYYLDVAASTEYEFETGYTDVAGPAGPESDYEQEHQYAIAGNPVIKSVAFVPNSPFYFDNDEISIEDASKKLGDDVVAQLLSPANYAGVLKHYFDKKVENIDASNINDY